MEKLSLEKNMESLRDVSSFEKGCRINSEFLCFVPSKIAMHYKIFPLSFEQGVLTIASLNPSDHLFLDELRVLLKVDVEAELASIEEIEEALRIHYGVGAATIDEMMDDVSLPDDENDEIQLHQTEASISTFLNQIFIQAYQDRATDIHIEPFESELQIRFRIDGVLIDANVPKNLMHFKDAIISRIKILSKLNIAEKRRPQDGRFKLSLESQNLDLRVSLMPTSYGESVVIRILNATRLMSFDQLGIEDEAQVLLKEIIKRPFGMIFLTGPTGSGKTTTLYSCLSQLDRAVKKIVTIEDPIEYRLRGITQIQTHQEIGLDFAQALRSVLRHDPDVMMVGEVRDAETAQIATQVALTGHLVFSTLHTNDAVGGVARLMDMGIEPYLITSTVECFIAQRLVRKLCKYCKAPLECVPQGFQEFEGLQLSSELVIYKALGCEQCHFTGYHGREALVEFFVMSDSIRKLILSGVGVDLLRAEAKRQGMGTLRDAGLRKIIAGTTSMEEVLRVTQVTDVKK